MEKSAISKQVSNVLELTKSHDEATLILATYPYKFYHNLSFVTFIPALTISIHNANFAILFIIKNELGKVETPSLFTKSISKKLHIKN